MDTFSGPFSLVFDGKDEVHAMELLAPAGGKEQLEFAIRFGADAVYLACERFGMRKRASNFKVEDLPWVSAYAHERGAAVHVACNTVMHEGDLKELPAYFEAVQKSGSPLLILAEDVDGEALATLILNKLRGTLNIAAVKAPGYGDRRKRMLEDIATLTGGQVAMKELGINLTDVSAEMLGRAKSVKITKENTTIVGGAGSREAIDERIAQIKSEIEHTDSDFDREKLKERLAKLSGGVAIIKVGAATEVELKEIKHRIEDALQATRAAVEEGIVAGGGVAFIEASSALDDVESVDADEKIGVEIIRKALEAPVRTIANNAGFEGSVVVEKIKGLPKGQGLDSATGNYGDMIEMGVLDPVKVSRVTLQNAASVASLILITEATVSDEPKDTTIEEAISKAAAAGGQGGGMY